MGATSVTGKGQGASFPGVKGPGNKRNTFVPILSPHVVAAGTAIVDDSNTVTVTFPTPLTGSESRYVIQVTPDADTTVWVTAKTDSSGNFVSFVINTGTSVGVMWTVTTAGNAYPMGEAEPAP